MFYIEEIWNGKIFGTKSEGLKSQAIKLAREVARYKLTPEQESWTLDECAQAVELGALHPYKVESYTPPHGCWAKLKIKPGSTRKQIAEAFRELALKHHPDMPNGDHMTFIQIRKAYETALTLAADAVKA